MLHFSIMLYCVPKLTLGITYIKFGTQNSIALEKTFVLNAKF